MRTFHHPEHLLSPFRSAGHVCVKSFSCGKDLFFSHGSWARLDSIWRCREAEEVAKAAGGLPRRIPPRIRSFRRPQHSPVAHI